MEAFVKLLNQSPLTQRQQTDQKTGEQKTVNCITLKLTDGIDTFLGEIVGDQALTLPVLDPTRRYRVQCSMVVREWVAKGTGKPMEATTIYINKICAA